MALKRLESGDLAGVRECEATLEQAVVELKRANELFEGLSAQPGGKLLETINRVRSEARQIEGIVDASAAFLRENFTLDNASAYGPDGQITNHAVLVTTNGTEA